MTVYTFWLVLYPAAMFICGLLGAVIAKNRRRDEAWWGVFCFLFPPLIVLLILLPRGTRRGGRNPLDDGHLGDSFF